MTWQHERYPRLRLSTLNEWAPSIHYAQYQVLQPGKLPPRRIYDFELIFVVQGEITTTMNDQIFPVSTGQIIFLPAGVLHQNEVISSPHAKLLGIHFDFFDELEIQTESDILVNEEAIQPEKFGQEAYSSSFQALSSQPVYTPSIACVKSMEQLVDEFTMRTPGFELLCRSLMLQVLTYLLRSQLADNLTNSSVHGSRISELMKDIEHSPAKAWSIKSLASQIQMNEDHFTKLFKKHAGTPPSEFIRSIRLREARKLLRETDLMIEEIGIAVGYPDIHYFSRIFRSHEGISPRAYRKLTRIL